MYGDYFPNVDFGGGIAGSSSFKQTELATVYGQSNDINSLTKGAFKQYLDDSHDIMARFNMRVGILEVQADRMRTDLLKAPSVVQQQIRQALDKNLKTQAALGATLMGPVSKVNNYLMNKNVREAHSLAISAVGAHIQEDIARKSLYYQELDKNNKNIIASLGGISQANMQGMNITASMTRGGLTTALGAASQLAGNRLKLMEQDIKERELGLRWEQSLLDSETNIYSDNMAYQGGIEKAVMNAQAMNYGSWIDARVKAYDSQNRARMHGYNTAMTGMRDIYATNVEDLDSRNRMNQDFALDVYQMQQDRQAAREASEANIIASGLGSANRMAQGLMVTGDGSNLNQAMNIGPEPNPMNIIPQALSMLPRYQQPAPPQPGGS